MSTKIEQLKTILPKIENTVPNLRKESANSLCGPCPKCHGTDRFVYRTDSKRFFCRQCNPKGGDVIDFHAWMEGTGIKGLIRKYLNGSKKSFNTPPGVHGRWKGKPYVAHWTYHDDDDGKDIILGHTVRYQTSPADKDVIPFFKRKGTDWKAGAAQKPRPLYNKHLLKRFPKKPLLIHEGEKASDAGNDLLGNHYLSITWPGGAQAVKYADWSLMRGRDVHSSPDKDKPGFEAARTVVECCYAAGAANCYIVEPPMGAKDGWDIADGFSDGWTEAEALLWIQNNAKRIDNPSNRTNSDKIKERAEKLLRDCEPPEPFPMSEIPEPVQSYVNQICERTDASPVLILISVLSAISAVVCKKTYIPEGAYFSRLYANVWSLIQSLSGSFKTTGLNKGHRLAWIKEARIRYEINELKEQRKNEKDGSSLKFIDEEIKDLQAQSCILPNRMSCEGLLELLSSGQGGVIPLSEFGGWLDVMEKSHATGLKPLFTDLFDVPQQYSYKTKSGGLLIIERPFISICGVSTPAWIQDHIKLKDVSSGFFARFLLFCPPIKKNVPPALPVIQMPFDVTIENQIKERLEQIQYDQPFCLAPSAAKLFQDIHGKIYSSMEQLSNEDQELLAPYVKRWSPYILKLALIFQTTIDPECRKIGVEAVQAGARIVEYAIRSTVFLFRGELGMSTFQRDCERIMKYIAKHDGRIDRYKILSSKILEGGAKDYDDVLVTLEESNRIELIPHKFGKKKYEIVRLIEDETKKYE